MRLIEKGIFSIHVPKIIDIILEKLVQNIHKKHVKNYSEIIIHYIILSCITSKKMEQTLV
jgi:hypothetical protein